MARRKRSLNLEISLFAFQDIIISVTGVLILIILLLVLEITISTVTDGLQQTFAASALELRAELKEVNHEVDQMTTELKDSSKLVKQATINPESTLNNKIAQENNAIDDLNKKLSHLDAITNDIQQNEQKHKQNQESIKQEKEILVTLKKKKKQLEKELTKISKGDRAHYLAPRGIHPKQAWLCDVSDRGLKLTIIDGSVRETILKTNDLKTGSPKLFNDLNLWLRKQKPSPQYVLFVIRPSGAYFSDILGLKGDQLVAEIGVEFVTEDHTTMHRKNED